MMTDGQEKKFPKVTVGVTIFNKNNRVFLMRKSSRFDGKYIIPGGHIEWGESIMQCLEREVKEETGLTIRDPELLDVVEFVLNPAYDSSRHIIPIAYMAYTDQPDDAVILEKDEAEEYVWMTEEEVKDSNEIEKTSKENILVAFEKQRSGRQLEEYKVGWQRALADYKNLQKETSDMRGAWAKASEQYILEEFIPVYENFKLAFKSQTAEFSPEQKKWVDGIGHIMSQFGSILKSYQVEEIKTVGEKFDPQLHESVGEEEVADTASGIILKEVSGGYKRGDKIIKPARVIISK